MRAILVACALALVAGGCNSNDNVQRLPIGSACATSGQCGTGKFFCASDHPNGYCKADCHGDKDCPSGSVCAGAGMVALGQCHKVCDDDGGCRAAEGYACKQGPDDASHAYCDARDDELSDGGA
jgi:hypothetical protein